MDALHQLTFFQGGFAQIVPALAVLGALAVALTVVAARSFRIQE
jgi:hypothetical protein